MHALKSFSCHFLVDVSHRAGELLYLKTVSSRVFFSLQETLSVSRVSVVTLCVYTRYIRWRSSFLKVNVFLSPLFQVWQSSHDSL